MKTGAGRNITLRNIVRFQVWKQLKLSYVAVTLRSDVQKSQFRFWQLGYTSDFRSLVEVIWLERAFPQPTIRQPLAPLCP
jgi:hypothetical protein